MNKNINLPYSKCHSETFLQWLHPSKNLHWGKILHGARARMEQFRMTNPVQTITQGYRFWNITGFLTELIN